MRAWDPYPFILLNLFLVHAGGHSGARHHDEPEPAGHKRSPAQRTGFRREPPGEAEIQGLASKMNLLGDKIADVEDLLRSKLSV